MHVGQSLLAFVALATTINLPVSALARSMRCELLEVLELSEEGILSPNRLEAAFRENDLVVDMDTGFIYHTGFGNESYPMKEILDDGSNESSFKTISSSIPNSIEGEDSGVFVNTIYLQIDVWVDGSKKPFLIQSGLDLGTGVCQ